MSKILGIDYGLKKIGLAIGNEDFKMAFPYKTIIKKNNQTLLTELKSILERENISKIVLGLPLYLNGETSLTTVQVKNFAQKLKTHFNLPVILVDERLTSLEAERRIMELNLKNKQKKKMIIDQLSAVLILENYFNQT